MLNYQVFCWRCLGVDGLLFCIFVGWLIKDSVMKIVFNIAHLATRGGKERVLVNKANYMAREWGAEVVVVTTEQKGRPVVYELDRRVRLVDLEAPYEDFRRSGVIANRLAQSACRRKHRRELTALLERERPDITVAMFGREVTWLPGVKDGSKKVLEYHFYKEVLKRDARRQPLLWLKYWWKMRAVRRYDRFVVLTEEDRRLWGNLKNIAVMPNALTFFPEQQASLTAKRVLAVGRLTEQKGFDRLIRLWADVAPRFPEWRLSIVGDGALRSSLQRQIEAAGLKSVELLPATPDVLAEYLNSSIYAMTSRYEGFPMVLLETMACGLPVVTYTCKCGPREIIRDGEDGFLVEEGDSDRFEACLVRLMKDERLRQEMGRRARENITRFSQENVMARWRQLYEELLGEKGQ